MPPLPRTPLAETDRPARLHGPRWRSAVATWLGRLAVLGCLIGLTTTVPAAPQDPTGRLQFRSYGREDGLGNLRVNLLLQDQAGFIWVGTDDGLYRFDGLRFQQFGEAQGLPSHLVNALLLDGDGALWVGTDKGLARWNGERFDANFAGLPRPLNVSDLASGPGKTLWLATPAGPYIGQAGRFHPLPGWQQGAVTALAQDPDQQTMWLGGRRYLGRWQAQSGWQAADASPFEDPRAILDQILPTADGRVWLRTSLNHHVLEPGERRFRTIAALPRADTYLSRMYPASDGSVWFPTESGLYHREGGGFVPLGLHEGLPTDFARAVLLDREGNLWIGSLGLHRLIGRGAWLVHTPKQGLPANVWAILRDRTGRLLVGTESGLVQADGKRWQTVSGSESYEIRTLVQAADGSILAAGDPYGLLRWDEAAGKAEKLAAFPDNGGRRVLRLLLDRSGRLWAGTLQGGLLRGEQHDGQWQFATEALPDGQPNERVAHLVETSEGHIWAAGSLGLACHDGQQWHRYRRADGLASNDVLYIAASGNSGQQFWLAYRDLPGKVSLIDGRCGQRLKLLAAPRLPDRDIYLLGEDPQGRLWVGHNGGLTLLQQPRQANSAGLRIGLEDGLVDEELNAMAWLVEPNGDAWVGTRGGMGQFRAAQFLGDPPPPKVAILSARLGSRQLLPGQRAIEVGYRDNTLEVDYAGLSFVDPASVHYATRLIGLEEDWRPSNSRELRYPALPAGHYQLGLRARFRDGPWGPVTQLDIRIAPPWWQTWWLRGGAVLLVLLLGHLALRWRLRSLRQRALILEQQVAARTAELASANEALLSQSLTDPLTGLHNRRYISQVLPEHVAQVNRDYAGWLRGSPASAHGIDMILVLIDIDHFKTINDRYGHTSGDRFLQQTAQILTSCMRESDIVARWGGEEFLLVARQTHRAEAGRLMERVRQRFAEHVFTLDEGVSVHGTCSIGFVCYPFVPAQPLLLDWQTLIRLADQCLYIAKHHGRNAWFGVEPADTAAVAQLPGQLGGDLLTLIREGQLKAQTSLAPFRPQDDNTVDSAR